ncbi:MAG: class I SAM-dependent methyltransferase [Ruminococcus sp.]|nr:class I SAM-dependent methyltransferase [Ruminococcus sp.]
MNNYSRFAQYYDLLTGNIDYNARADYFDSIVEKFGGVRGILLDLGCGTGSLTECMARKGYDVLGIDISQEMLTVALDKKFESDLPIQYLHQDMRKIDLYGTVDVTVCALDALNHIDDGLDGIDKTFERVSLFTNPDGLFIFDMNTIYKHKNIIADNTFVYDMDDVYCVWQNTYKKKNNEIEIELDFFEKNGNVYYRSEESFSEFAYDENDIDALLEKHGFKIEAHYDYDSFDAPHKKSEKVIFVARKVK